MAFCLLTLLVLRRLLPGCGSDVRALGDVLAGVVQEVRFRHVAGQGVIVEGTLDRRDKVGEVLRIRQC